MKITQAVTTKTSWGLQHCLHEADVTESAFQETGSWPVMQPWRKHSPKPALATSPGRFGGSLQMLPSFLQGIQKPLEESFQAQETEYDLILICWVNEFQTWSLHCSHAPGAFFWQRGRFLMQLYLVHLQNKKTEVFQSRGMRIAKKEEK